MFSALEMHVGFKKTALSQDTFMGKEHHKEFHSTFCPLFRNDVHKVCFVELNCVAMHMEVQRMEGHVPYVKIR